MAWMGFILETRRASSFPSPNSPRNDYAGNTAIRELRGDPRPVAIPTSATDDGGHSQEARGKALQAAEIAMGGRQGRGAVSIKALIGNP